MDTAPAQLRDALVDQLVAAGAVRSAPIEAALRGVPRHAFLPEVPVERAYADQTVPVSQDAAGETISAASQPSIVAMQLDQLAVSPGDRVLELGTGTGYNAALLAHLVGDSGVVTTIDVDAELVARARDRLAAAGADRVRVLHGDGGLGAEEGAPYDRILATVGAWDVPLAWLDQLAPGGRLVAPIRIAGCMTRSFVLVADGPGRWRSPDSRLCSFMPLRDGPLRDPARTVALTPDRSVTLRVHQDQRVDPATLTGVLDRPRELEWTGVRFARSETWEWLFLWLACALPDGLSRLPVQRSATEAGVVTPAMSWGTVATTAGGALAYLTSRPAEPGADGSGGVEVGVVGHGHDATGASLAAAMAAEVRGWDQDRRGQEVRFDLETADPPRPTVPGPGRFVLPRPGSRLVVAWH